MTTTAVAEPAPQKFRLAGSVRSGAIVALLGLPLWIVCFVLLYGSMTEKPEGSASQIIAAYQAAGPAIWAFAIVGPLAVVAMVAGVVMLARAAGPHVLARLAAVAAALAGPVFLVNAVGIFAMLAADSARPPAWIDTLLPDSPANHVFNGIAFSLLAVAVTLLVFALRAAGLLHRRGGLVLGIVAAVLSAAMIGLLFFQPMLPAALEFAIGLSLLLRRRL